MKRKISANCIGKKLHPKLSFMSPFGKEGVRIFKCVHLCVRISVVLPPGPVCDNYFIKLRHFALKATEIIRENANHKACLCSYCIISALYFRTNKKPTTPRHENRVTKSICSLPKLSKSKQFCPTFCVQATRA